MDKIGSSEDLLRSAYQVAREANLRRNLEELRAIGLIGDDYDLNLGCKKTSKAKRARAEPKTPSYPVRKSKRLQHLAPDDSVLALEDNADEEEVEESENLESATVRITMERKIARLKALHEENATGYKNPTATYEHTWMRVKSMSDPALERRIAVIEKACGQHCIVKMRMFAEVLIVAGKNDLAEQAKAALERIQALIIKK
jgi:hypothetical protein